MERFEPEKLRGSGEYRSAPLEVETENPVSDSILFVLLELIPDQTPCWLLIDLATEYFSAQILMDGLIDGMRPFEKPAMCKTRFYLYPYWRWKIFILESSSATGFFQR
jgi:hypothetical protein